MASASFRVSRFNLGVKLSLFVVVLVLVVSASMAYFLVVQMAVDKRKTIRDQAQSLALFLGSIRGGQGMARGFEPAVVNTLVKASASMGTDVTFVIFTDIHNQVKGGTFNEDLLRVAAPDLASTLAGLGLTESLTRLADWKWTSESIESFPVNLKFEDGSKLGRVIVGFSTVKLDREISRSVFANLVVTLGAFLAGLAGAIWLARHFTRPIREVASAMQGVSAGELDQTLVIRSRDEVGVLAQAFNFMTKGLRERERIRSTFARYVSDQVADRILKEEDEVDLQGELRRVTVLFLDIRGFTTLTEHLPPREVVALLNDYFGIIIEIIFEHEGTINKFIGDSIMAIFGAPADIDFPEARSVLTAVKIQRAIGEFNWSRMQEGKSVVNFGIGVHTGEAIAGNVGSARRMEYTVIGRDVNLAQRIENATREGQILISGPTYEKIINLVEVQAKEAVFMKGILEPIPLYQVTGMKIKSLEEVRARAAAASGSRI